MAEEVGEKNQKRVWRKLAESSRWNIPRSISAAVHDEGINFGQKWDYCSREYGAYSATKVRTDTQYGAMVFDQSNLVKRDKHVIIGLRHTQRFSSPCRSVRVRSSHASNEPHWIRLISTHWIFSLSLECTWMRVNVCAGERAYTVWLLHKLEITTSRICYLDEARFNCVCLPICACVCVCVRKNKNSKLNSIAEQADTIEFHSVFCLVVIIHI